MGGKGKKRGGKGGEGKGKKRERKGERRDGPLTAIPRSALSLKL